tara:strand:- start:1125 stop:1355 length:231 start_codon:yes stop_codon:yes gene_type:complete
MKANNVKYYQNSTIGTDKYEFLYDEVKRDIFTNEQVSCILEKIEFALDVYSNDDNARHSVDNAKDVIAWIKKEILG